MKFSVTLLACAPVLFGLAVAVAQGCGSSTQSLADGTIDQGVGANQGMGGSGGGAPAAPVVQVGGMQGPITCELPTPHPTCAGVNTDINCNTTNASTSAACTQDCRVECGFDGMGTKVCSCTSGFYSECPCARPASYLGGTSATFCTIGGGTEAELDEQPCTTEWDQCITTDPQTGTPHGCVCKTGSESGMLEWFCGSTNNWFQLETGGANAVCQGAMPDPTCAGINADMNCNTSNARSQSSCTRDCRVSCGYQGMGLKICTCEGGAYTQCPCPKPPEYLGAPTAPACSTFGSPDGTADALDDTPCTTEWDQCIGTDVVTGTTPRGCACLTNVISGTLQWYCGSTNRWFAPE